MICVMETPIDVAIWVALANLIKNQKGFRATQPAVCALTWQGKFLASMVPAEKLHLLGHGGTTTIGGMFPAVLAGKLLSAGLPAHISHIKVSACRSGEGIDPPCKKLMEELLKQSTEAASKQATGVDQNAKAASSPATGVDPAPAIVKLPVVGFKGLVVTTDLGKTRAKDDVKRAQRKKEYDAIFDTKTELKLRQWEAKASSLKTDTEKDLIDNAEIMREDTKELFEKLHTFNPSVLLEQTPKSNFKYKALPT
jgi:hypothetical protein